MERQKPRMKDNCVLTMRMPPLPCTTISLEEDQPEGSMVEENVALKLNRLQPFGLFHVVRS